MSRYVFAAAAGSAFAVVSLFSAPVARAADVKVVSEVTFSGASGPMAAQAPRGSQTLTTYYKGSKTRTETGGDAGGKGGAVSIYDAQTNTLTLLNNKQQTYSVTSMQGLAQNPALAMMDFKTTATLKPGGKTQTIAGKPAKNYLWQATISMSMNSAAMPKGAQGGSGASKMPTGPLFSIKMDGEQWTTEAVKLPGTKSMLPALMSGPLRSIPGLSPLVSKLSGIKGLPLSSTITQTFTQGAAMAGMPGAGAGQLPQKPLVSRTQVVSISEAPLPDALFAPPANFRKTESKMPGGKMSM